jgi:uncharacterized protein YndB with AHSA1/START domain
MSNDADPRTTWALDREIVLSRVISAPRPKVFEAWTKAEHLSQWFGPAGFTVENIECDVRVGGRWRFVMVAPDGTRFDNRMVFLEVVAPERLVIDHGKDVDDDPGRFRVTVTFDEQDDSKTVLTLRQLHPTREQRQAGIGFGAVELGHQTLAKLAQHVEG